MSWIPREWNERANKRVNEAFAAAVPGAEVTHAED
jgi:hypothetical protein